MSDRARDAPVDGASAASGAAPPGKDDGTDGGNRTGGEDTAGEGRPVGRDRVLGAVVAAFVAVHLLAPLALGDPSLPALVVTEVVAVGLLVVGDAVATGRRRAATAAVGVLVSLGAVGAALGPAEAAPWVVAVGLLAAAAAALYAGHRYDRHLAGGGSA